MARCCKASSCKCMAENFLLEIAVPLTAGVSLTACDLVHY